VGAASSLGPGDAVLFDGMISRITSLRGTAVPVERGTDDRPADLRSVFAASECGIIVATPMRQGGKEPFWTWTIGAFVLATLQVVEGAVQRRRTRVGANQRQPAPRAWGLIYGVRRLSTDVSVLSGTAAGHALVHARSRSVRSLYWSKSGDWYEVQAATEAAGFVEESPPMPCAYA